MNLNEIGVISVRVFVVKNRQQHNAESIAIPEVQNHSPPLIDERTKKAGQHCVS